MWRGMNDDSGKAILDVDHVRQSIHKILTTPIGTRVMRRNFGSVLPDLIDAPINEHTRLQVLAATATAVVKWEPRLRPVKVALDVDGSSMAVELTAALREGPTSGAVTMRIPLR
jgi:phage baseplate assembly protein W